MIGVLALAAASAADEKAEKKSDEEPKPLPTIAQKTKGLQAAPGFFTFYWDAPAGKIWLEIAKFDSEFLYVNSLATGVGSNDIGLDRGQFGGLDGGTDPEHLVRFVRIGAKVLLTQANLRYRAVSPNADERAAVAEAFAESTLWGFKVEAEENGRVLVDATPFLLTDAHGVADKLKATKQGTYKVDEARSAVFLPRTKSFPKNTEFEATLTFVGDPEGDWIRSVAPVPKAVTVREHHSFVELPDNDYEPRVFDPRSGYYPFSYADYATPVQEPLVKRFVPRHRLRKKDPSAAMSDPVEPIVYYMDRGAPEPIKSALMEGASWWNQAFEAAGYTNAFRVEELPIDADPMDLRYNMIEWIHRSTRGWSYGVTVADPRTGEIIKGHVSLGSLRVRQDFMIAQGLVQAYGSGDGTEPDPRLLEMSLARLRQLAAHEVGHTLGLQHNFAASASSGTSVMDYPPPFVAIGNDGKIDLSRAYGTSIGEWDKRTILYGYQHFPEGTDERAALASILQENIAKGFHYITDSDARPTGSAHPLAHLWDTGKSAVDELNRIVQVRALALSRFGEKNIRAGAPMATLENVLVPVYLAHRYQAEAAAKLIGGVDYTYAARGDGQPTNQPLPAATQRAALAAIVQTLRPEFLELPDEIIRLIPPRAPGYDRDRELFEPDTGLTFDPLAAAESWINTALGLVFNPERLTRVLEQKASGKADLTAAEIVDAVFKAAGIDQQQSGYRAELARMIEKAAVQHLLRVASNTETQQQVAAVALQKISEVEKRAQSRATGGSADAAHNGYLALQIERFRRNPKELDLPKPARIPAGPPIGMPE
ncbi:MAG TPA: zinc-dependent metalloprotease [Chthoniobacterales bacterium]|nr:zinc-dependent metalloprotease [Chthoniobacterales bacterium]